MFQNNVTDKIFSLVFFGKDTRYNFAVLDPSRWFLDRAQKVTYFKINELQNLKIHIKEGLFYKGERLFNTSCPGEVGKYKTHFLYTFDKNHNIYITPKFPSENRKIYNSSILSGKPVITAGYLRVENGKLKEIDNGSIHYNHPSAGCMFKLISYFRKNKVDLDNFKVIFYSKQPKRPIIYNTAMSFLSEYPYPVEGDNLPLSTEISASASLVYR